MAELAEIRTQVEGILVDTFGQIDVAPDGAYRFPFDSTRVLVYLDEWTGTDHVVVIVFGFVTLGTPASPELFRWLATHDAYIFGHVGCVDNADGTVNVHFRHTLLGDHIDGDELATAIEAVAVTADSLDDEIVQQFGGRTYADAIGG